MRNDEEAGNKCQSVVRSDIAPEDGCVQSVGSAEYSYIHERTSNIVRVKEQWTAQEGGVDHLTTLCATSARQ